MLKRCIMLFGLAVTAGGLLAAAPASALPVGSVAVPNADITQARMVCPPFHRCFWVPDRRHDMDRDRDHFRDRDRDRHRDRDMDRGSRDRDRS